MMTAAFSSKRTYVPSFLLTPEVLLTITALTTSPFLTCPPIEERYKHPLYKKTVKKTHKFKAHDEANACGIGDKVLIVETRKLSKDKNWRVAEIVEKAK